MSRTNSLGRYTQSIRAKDICILLVNADYICRSIVADMLDQCRYEAFSYEREMDALNIILEKKDVIELILTNVHRTYASRCGFIERIEKEFKLQIILMSPDVDDIKNTSIGCRNGVTVYFMKSLSVNEMNNLWATALAREKSKNELSSGNSSRVENAGSKGTKEDNEQNGNTEKKPRVVWTKEMHKKFLEAVEQLGHDKAFPKKIVELMNVPGLTRENVASHLQKYRMCMKRAQEGFTSSYDFNDPLGLNTSQENFQQLHWNPFQTGSRITTTTRFGFNTYKSTSRTSQHISLLNTIRLKPDHNFRVYGDEKKNVLLSIEDSRGHPNTSFAGFRLTHDGKSVVFGQNSRFGNNGVNESYIQSQSASSVQQQPSFPEVGNDDSTHCPFIAPPGTGSEPVRFSSQLSSLAALLAVDEPTPAILTQTQPSAILTQPQLSAAPAPPVFDWNKAATFIQPPSSVASPWLDWEDPLRFTCQQPAIMVQPQSAGMQWCDHWAEPPSFSPQQPASGNTANANSDIFSDFSSSLPPGFCELGLVGDENVVDATEMSIFDDLLFDNQDLT